MDALPELAGRTKNFSGAELEGLVKSAASYALRRCVDVAGDNAIDEASLKVEKRDFDHAPRFGRGVRRVWGQGRFIGTAAIGTASWISVGHFREVDDALRRLVEQVRTSAKTPLMTVLLEGRAHTGKTALAARTAVTSEFPFVRLLIRGLA